MDLEQFRIKADNEKATLVAFLNNIEQDMPASLDTSIGKVDEEVWKKVDCLTCANCCKTMMPAFTNEDVARIATRLRMKPADFKKRWLKKDVVSGQWMNKQQPCQFLHADNTCAVYDVRPASCAEFPHHTKTPFNAYSYTFKNNLGHCPATLLFIEKLAGISGD